jgi:hypothetical protein
MKYKDIYFKSISLYFIMADSGDAIFVTSSPSPLDVPSMHVGVKVFWDGCDVLCRIEGLEPRVVV